jgi:hypothetical protein
MGLVLGFLLLVLLLLVVVGCHTRSLHSAVHIFLWLGREPVDLQTRPKRTRSMTRVPTPAS